MNNYNKTLSVHHCWFRFIYLFYDEIRKYGPSLNAAL